MAEQKTEEKQSGERGQAPSASRVQQSSGQGESRSLSRRQEFMPSLPSWSDSPFALMRRLSEDMDRIFGEFFNGSGMPVGSMAARSAARAGLQGAQWTPAIEVSQKDHQLIVCAELPGLSKDDIDVEVTGDWLTISGERREEREENERATDTANGVTAVSHAALRCPKV